MSDSRNQKIGAGGPRRIAVAGVALATLALVVGSTSGHPSQFSETLDPTLVADLNAAPAQVLESLPRLGPVLVGRIVAEREARPFAAVDDLDGRVRGIGPATLASVRPFLKVAGPNE